MLICNKWNKTFMIISMINIWRKNLAKILLFLNLLKLKFKKIKMS